MAIRRLENSHAYARHATSWLLEAEAEHNLLLGILQQLASGDHSYEPPLYLATAEDKAGIQGCAFRTPPFPVGLTHVPAAAMGETPNGVRIGYVYTPPAQRRQGYASALVAKVSQHLLTSGRRFCFLYTDLANPTTNAIYQNIGYRPVCEVVLYRFGTGIGRR